MIQTSKRKSFLRPPCIPSQWRLPDFVARRHVWETFVVFFEQGFLWKNKTLITLAPWAFFDQHRINCLRDFNHSDYQINLYVPWQRTCAEELLTLHPFSKNWHTCENVPVQLYITALNLDMISSEWPKCWFIRMKETDLLSHQAM